MTSQLDLELPSKAPEVTQEQIDQLVDFLRGRGWMTAAEIEAELKDKKINERKIRKIAEFSEGRILSGPGCPGYKLFTGATEIDEADLCATRIESQARQIIMRAASIRRRFHRYART